MSTQPAQSRTIRAQLLSDMREGRYAACERLPRESVLAEKLGISRTQLRDVLASLEREGFITRRHGVGTIINRHVLNAHTRMDIEVEFLDMIRQSGHQAAVAFVRAEDALADAHVSRHTGGSGLPALHGGRQARNLLCGCHRALTDSKSLYAPGPAVSDFSVFAGVLRSCPVPGPDRPAPRDGGRCLGGALWTCHRLSTAVYG